MIENCYEIFVINLSQFLGKKLSFFIRNLKDFCKCLMVIWYVLFNATPLIVDRGEYFLNQI